MVDRAEHGVAGGEFSAAKLGRWLGWAQCAVVAADIGITLEDMKALNMRHAEVFSPSPGPGYAVVEMPEGEELAELLNEHGLNLATPPTSGRPVSYYTDDGETVFMSVEEARRKGSAYLAAARAADEKDDINALTSTTSTMSQP